MRHARLVLLASLVACGGGDSPSSPVLTVGGAYHLDTVNGSKLPYLALQSGTTTVTITADQLFIADGGTWNEDQVSTVVLNGVTSTQHVADNGTWSTSGNAVTLFSTRFNQVAYAGTASTNRLDVAFKGTAYVFLK